MISVILQTFEVINRLFSVSFIYRLYDCGCDDIPAVSVDGDSIKGRLIFCLGVKILFMVLLLRWKLVYLYEADGKLT